MGNHYSTYVSAELNGNSFDEWKLAVLMQIRDEIKELNALLHCSNFTGIPHTLRQIQQETLKTRLLVGAKKRKKKASVTNIRKAA